MKVRIVLGFCALALIIGGCNTQQPAQTAGAPEKASVETPKAPAQEAVAPVQEVKAAVGQSQESSAGQPAEDEAAAEAAKQAAMSAMAPLVKETPLAAAAVKAAGIAVSQDPLNEFVVYIDKGHQDNHFIPSGYMGDFGDIVLNDKAINNPHGGSTCIQVVYSGKKAQGQGWAGVYWQNPQNNWGTKQGGFNLSGITKLTFWARGEKGKEVIQKFMVGGIKGAYADSVSVEMGPVELTPEWKEYTINLAGKELSYVSGGFGWATNAESNANGCTFYLDDIRFVADASLKPEGKKVQDMPFGIYMEKGAIGNHFIPSGWMGDYGDIKLDNGSAETPHAGATCIKITYNNKATQGARWAGMYWQNPPNNWGTVDAGFNLSKATKLTFWARGEKGGEQIAEFKVGGIMGQYSDSDVAMFGPVALAKEWTQYTIDLKGKDMSNIIGGFCWSSNIDMNPDGVVFYLDDILFE